MTGIDSGDTSPHKINDLFSRFPIVIQHEAGLTHMGRHTVPVLFKEFGSDVNLVDSVFHGFNHLLSGYAMYLGRFIRFNSWDVLLNPGTLLKFLLDNLHGEAFRFTISFGMLSFLVYLLFGLFLYLGPEDPFKDQRISRKSTG